MISDIYYRVVSAFVYMVIGHSLSDLLINAAENRERGRVAAGRRTKVV